jgi:cyclase
MAASKNRTLFFLLCLCVPCMGARGAGNVADFADRPISGSVHLLQGFDCNVVASVAGDGILLVDTCSAESAESLLASLRRLSKQPLRFIVDTHAHADHTGGNAFFQKLAPVIAHVNTRQWLVSGNAVTGDKPVPTEALPAITIAGEVTLHLEDEDVTLWPLPPAHTDSDVVVFFRKANVVAMGDVFMSPAVSFADKHYGSSMLKLIDALERILPRIPTDAVVIPGHGAPSKRADIAHGLEVLKQMKELVERAISNGKTEAQLLAERPFDRWRAELPTWSSSNGALDRLVRDFYRQLVAANGGG